MDVATRWTSTVVLGDGTSALIRPITPDDAAALAAFHVRQSPDSRYLRFFSPKPELTDTELERFTTVDFVDRVAFVVEDHGEFVAWASYERWNNRDDAEVAFMVDDRHHGKGIATLLLEHLAAVARSNGIHRFTAQTLGDNRGMLAVFAKAGWPVHRKFESGVVDIDFALEDTASFIDSVERREQRADSRAMARVLLATSVAVIGASDSEGTIGGTLWRRLAADPARRTYPVNPHHATVGGVTSYASVTDIPEEVGLAIVAVPAAALPATIEQCIEKRVRGAVVVTNVDDVDIDMPALVARARSNGLRIIGPGSMGIASPRDDVALQAALVDVRLQSGNVAISLQSGTLGSALLTLAAHLQLATSWFVSLGDKSDVSGNDLLQFWEDDVATRVIAIYSESLGNPRKFARIARRVALTRPIVAVRTGTALADDGTDALYAHTGVIQVPTVTAMLDTARTLSTQPLMRGRRVAVVSNSLSPTVLATAALQGAGLEVVPAPQPLTWRSTSDDYAAAMSAAIADDGIDAIMVIHAPPLVDAIGEPSAAVDDAGRESAKPIVAVMLGAGNGPMRAGSSIPSFRFPEQPAAVLGRIATYSEWRRRAEQEHAADESTVTDDIDADGAGAIIAAHIDEGEAAPEVARALLECYGVTMAAGRRVAAAEATAAAAEIGFPVAVKATHRRIGRTVGAGVALDLTDAADVESAVAAMLATLGDGAAQVIVQKMVPPGLDTRVRVRDDARLGPVISVGLGGLQADAIDDEESRLAPISRSGAATMIAGTRASSALRTHGRERLADVVARVSRLAADHPEIDELDLNPVVVNEEGCWVVDARLTLCHPDQAGPSPRRLEDR